MSENKLTAEEFFEVNFDRYNGTNILSEADFYRYSEMKDQQTAAQDARIKELESVLSEVYKNRAGEKEELISSINRIKELEEESVMWRKRFLEQKGRADAEAKSGNELAKTIVQLAKELEAVKKERANWKEEYDILLKDRDEVRIKSKQRKDQRDEAVKLLQDERSVIEGKHFEEWNIDRLEFLSRLSSGETKPEYVECPDCVAVNRLSNYEYYGLDCCCQTCMGKGEIEKITPANNSIGEQVICEQPCDYESIQNNECNCIAPIEESKPISPWISVEDRPLAIITKIGWECTEDGMHEFIAAVPERDKRSPGVELWWIKHCVIEDEIGLCIVGDNENIPAGWSLQDITHYWPLPAPPESLTDKK